MSLERRDEGFLDTDTSFERELACRTGTNEGKTPYPSDDNDSVPNRKLRVAIVEDQPLFRDLLSSSLAQLPDIEIVCTCGTVKEARKLITDRIEVVVLDVELPDGNGIGLGVSLKRQYPRLGVVTLSVLDMLETMFSLEPALRHGWSYLLKQSASDMGVLAHAIRQSARGVSVTDPELTRRAKPRAGTVVANLTRRQFEIMRMVARGDSNESIATELGIAENSVVNHLTAIYGAFGIMDGKNARVSATLEFLANTQRD